MLKTTDLQTQPICNPVKTNQAHQSSPNALANADKTVIQVSNTGRVNGDTLPVSLCLCALQRLTRDVDYGI
jgi:hypothetical protein